MKPRIDFSTTRLRHSRSFAYVLGGIGFAVVASSAACAHSPPPAGGGGNSTEVAAPGSEQAAAGDGLDEAFCSGAGRGWFDVGQALDAGCYPPEPCGDAGFRVPAAVVEVYGWEDDHFADGLSEENVSFRLMAAGNWPQHSTTRQQRECTARLCGPGTVVIESRYCFSETAPWKVDFSMQPASTIAGCSPGHLPPGHYTATVDGISVEFDVPQTMKPGEGIEQRAWERFDTHPCPGDVDPNGSTAERDR